VPVDLSAAAPAGPPAVPAVLNFAVRSTSTVSVAPATFRITGEVRDAETCVWDFGDGRTEATEEHGKIDRLVTFEKAGDYTVQLFAHNGKHAVKLACPVRIANPSYESLSLTLRVTDSGTRSERTARSESLVVPVPKDAKGTFTRTITPRPGYVFAGAGVPSASVPGLKNVGFAVPDGRTAVLTAEWDVATKGPNKATGGSDVIIPLAITEQRLVAIKPVVNVVGGSTVTGRYLGASSTGVQPAAYSPPREAVPSFELPLPAPPGGLAQHTRQFQVEVRHTCRPQPVFQGPVASLPWSGVFATPDGQKWVCSITPEGAKAIVSFNTVTK
jgi:hypothetical protein